MSSEVISLFQDPTFMGLPSTRQPLFLFFSFLVVNTVRMVKSIHIQNLEEKNA